MSRRLNIILPGLESLPDSALAGLSWRELSASSAHPGSLEALLFELFGLEREARDLPVAPLTLWADRGDPPGLDEVWLRADPVHLRAEPQAMLLFDASKLGLDALECRAFIAELREFEQEADWRLIAPSPQRWYLRLPDLPRMRACPLSKVKYRNIADCVPEGEEGLFWRGRLNAVQMALHASPLNQAREARGHLPLNSLWFWGQGRLPQTVPAPPLRIWSDHPLVTGLCRLSQTECSPPPGNLAAMLASLRHAPPGEYLLLWEHPSPQNCFLLEPDNLRTLARKASLNEIRLYGDERCLILRENALIRWWRHWRNRA